jgi:uncharacterized protein (DUF1810 family)
MNELDPHKLRRFIEAQAPVIEQVQRELRAGRKTTHWMWFIFPQLAGLGHSDTARFYAIASRAEAVAYLDHPILGPRLLDCTRIVLGLRRLTAQTIFGTIDAAKFRSCMTLFSIVDPATPEFKEALDRYYDGTPDKATLNGLS